MEHRMMTCEHFQLLQFHFLFNMFVRCLTIIQDPILDFKIGKYINRTPFLTINNVDDKTLNIVGQNSSETDLIVVEATVLSLEGLRNLQLRYKDKFFIILTDLLANNNLQKGEQTIVLSKNVTYNDFIEGLSSLADNKIKCSVQHTKIKNVG